MERGEVEGFPMDAPCHQKGFSLLELLIVVMILGILGMAVVPQMQNLLSDNKLDEAAKETVIALEYVRQLAAQHQRPFGLAADVGGNWLEVFDQRYRADSNAHTGDLPPVSAYGVVQNPLDKNWYRREFNALTQFAGVRIQTVPGSGVILFYPDGHSAATDSSFVIALGGRQKTVTVNGTSGRITSQ
jgi:type II secretion system protein H